MKILVATTNQAKFTELINILDSQHRFLWLSLSDFENIPQVIEDGATFAENAAKKALEYAKAANLWTIADDSGLVIDALDGAPGVHSARFSGQMPAGENRSVHDVKNMQKVLELMKGVPRGKRTARFVCHICLAEPERILARAEGTMEGLIADRPAGENGFGYDPIMYIPEKGCTAAQLDSEEKNRISHRGKALARLKPQLEKLTSL